MLWLNNEFQSMMQNLLVPVDNILHYELFSATSCQPDSRFNFFLFQA